MVGDSLNFPFPTERVVEGTVEVVVPRLEAFIEKPSDYAPSKAPVFYNPVMELNRDLAVLALQVFQRSVGREVSVCEPLTGCGVRGVRLAREVEGVGKVVVNDINGEAYRLAKYNVDENGLSGRVTVEHEDANSLLNRFGAPRRRFDYVDVDPFGSPMPYVDSAFRALRCGGLLAVTATDLASLCGVYPRACVRKYGGKPLRVEYCHELAVRLLAGALARTAAKLDVGVRMVFSHSSEHYVRLYTLVGCGAKKADESLDSLGFVYHCHACSHRESALGMFQCGKVCPVCGAEMAIAGPLWLGRIASDEFVASMLAEAGVRGFRLKKVVRHLLGSVSEEADGPVGLFVVDNVCDRLGLRVPSVRRVVEELRRRGSRACLTHFHPCGFRTDASTVVVDEVVKGLV